MDDERLIERWLPIAELSEESVRERRSLTALPPTYYLHVWWARRPLVASRAAVLASLLPSTVERSKFRHVLGIHGDPVGTRRRLDAAKITGERLGVDPYGYKRAFSYTPSEQEREWIISASARGSVCRTLDPTAGGGSIPFEASRLGITALANDLNPVAWLVLKATTEFPQRFGRPVLRAFEALSAQFVARASAKYEELFARESAGAIVDAYLWARTIECPYCSGVVPLSPNWRLQGKDVGVRVLPGESHGKRQCTFEIVHSKKLQSVGTVKGGDARCPFPDCERVIDGGAHIKPQAQAGRMGDQLYAVVLTERRTVGHTKSGRPRTKKVRTFRAPRPEDDLSAQVGRRLAARLPEWEALGVIPDEAYPQGTNDDRPRQYGMPRWRDLFSPRQLYGHATSVETFRELIQDRGGVTAISEVDRAAFTYLALAIDKLIDWNSRACTWDVMKQRMSHTFARHDFAFRASYAEMAPCITGLGYEWVTAVTGKALRELISLSGSDSDAGAGLDFGEHKQCPPAIVTCGSGDDLASVEDASVDAVVMDPPYYDNVMYAELADFFYVWLKRTAGLLYPSEFSTHLTDKDREAVANVAKFKDFTMVRGTGGARRRASRDYQERMQAIFAEAHRVLKPGGILTLMFTHKATGAWDALAMGLVQAGFSITASWPIHTEAEGSLHIKDKNAAKSTILLVCRPRVAAVQEVDPVYWEDVEPKVRDVVHERVSEFQEAGIGGVDLYLACFGPALQVFSENWPMTRGRAQQRPRAARGANLKLFEDEEWDPYSVRPEDALMAARTAVKEWRLDRISSLRRKGHLDPVTEWFVLAWDAFGSPQFPADEALKLARVVGVDFDERLRGRVLDLKGSNVTLWDSGVRAHKASLGSMTADVLLDVLHRAAHVTRQSNTGAAERLLAESGLVDNADLHLALQALLGVLPPPNTVTAETGALAGAARDAEALEAIRRLVFAKDVPPPPSHVAIGLVLPSDGTLGNA